MRGGLGGSTRKALTGGSGLLMLGGVAYAAFEHFSQQKTQNKPPAMQPGMAPPPPPPPPGMASAPPPPPPSMTAPPHAAAPAPSITNGKALLLIKAMIAAAKADGEIDQAERAHILKALDNQGQGSEAHEFVEAEMAKPLNLFEITSQVTDEITAMQVYTASCMAIDIDTDEERQYLDKLAARIGIEPEQAREIEAGVNAPMPPSGTS